MQRARCYPTPVFAAGLAIGGLALAVAAIAGPALIVVDLIWVSAVLIFGIVDRHIVINCAKNFNITRQDSSALILASPSDVTLEITNRSNHPVKVSVKDTPPSALSENRPVFRQLLHAGQSRTVSYSVLPSRRGVYSFGDIWYRLSTPVGLFAYQAAAPATSEVTVKPNINLSQDASLLTRLDRKAIGYRASRLLGTGQEFQSLREWVPEDGMRPVDWKATARRGKMVSREYEAERSQNVAVLIDLGRTMATLVREGNLDLPVSKVDYAVGAATLLGWVCTQTRDNFGVAGFESEVQAFVPPAKGAEHLRKVQDVLSRMEARMEEPNFRTAFQEASQTIRRRSLIVVLTDIADRVSAEILARELQRFRPRHLVLVIAVTDQELIQALEKMPESERDVYTQAVAESILEDRQRTLVNLRAHGILALDVNPRDLNISIINAYLDIKRQGLL